MRIAIITDIHEDFQMLEKAMSSLKNNGYDMLICLGDITGYAPEYYGHTPDASSCLELLREYADVTLAGNHDLFSSKRLPSYHLGKNIPANWYELSLQERYLISNNTLWLYEEEITPELSPENEGFINSLAEKYVLDVETRKLLFSHFLQPDLLGVGRWFPYRIGELRPHFRLMDEHKSTLAFVGHCHPEGLTIVSKLFWTTPCFESIRISQKPRIVLCPAIVRSKKLSGYLIFDTILSEITPVYLSS